MFEQTITIYNKTDEDRYFRTVIKGVFWDSSEGATTRKTGKESADGVQIIIPLCGRTDYLKPKEWERSTAHGWTAKAGDLVVLGEDVPEITSIRDLRDVDDVVIVTHVDWRDYAGDMAHLEVIGR